MSDPEPAPSDQLDQLFAAPVPVPVPPENVTHSLTLPDPQAPSPAAKQPPPQGVSYRDGLRMLTPVMWVTPLLLTLNVGYYLLMISQGVHPWMPKPRDLIAWGADYSPLTWNGQPWRLLSSVFVHFGIMHLGMNMQALWAVGRDLERLVGNVGYLIIYLASGVAGSLASLWWHGDVVSVSAGASGAIFGLFGAQAAFIWNRSDSFSPEFLSLLRKNLVTCILINLLLGAAIEGIDEAAHIGGLVCGLVCGAILSQPLDRYTRARRLKKNLIAATAALLVLGIMVMQHPPAPSDLFVELGIHEKIVPTTIDNFYVEFEKWHKKKITAPQLVEFVKKEILPPWEELREHIDHLKNVPSSRRGEFHQIRQQLLVREESWKLMIEALEKNDAERFDEFQDKWKQANQLRVNLVKKLKPPQ